MIVIIWLTALPYLSAPYEKQIWVPENATLLNLVDGKFVPITQTEISGTAVAISLNDYREHFNKGKENTVIIEETTPAFTSVYYQIKTEGKTYFAEESFFTLLHDTVSAEVSEMTITLKNSRDTAGIIVTTIIVVFIGFCVAVLVGKGLSKIGSK